MIFQIGVVVFAGAIIARTYGQYKKESISRYWLLAFSTMWVIIAGAAMIPRAMDSVAQFLGVERAADLFVYVTVLLLLYVVYRLMVRTQKMHEEITELVRRITIDNAQTPVQTKKNEEEKLAV